MILNDFSIILYWWLILLVLGVLCFPIAFSTLEWLWDKGWGFAKIIAILFLSYWVWVSGSLHILPFSQTTIWVGIFLLAWFSYSLFRERKKSIQKFVIKHWKLLLFEELVFGLFLVVWSLVRAHQPDINGLEKFMDFGFVNSILRTNFFPPADLWLAGETINYYYFGHLVSAVLTKLSGFSSSVTYNLMIASLMALSFVAAFSLGSSLLKILIQKKQGISSIFLFLSGLVSGIVFVFGGNLHVVFKLITEGLSNYWYPDATRYIPYTIHEFPLYSFVVSDLHGHVSNIPFVLLVVALIVGFVSLHSPSDYSKPSRRTVLYYAFLGFVFGVLYMTNALDAPIYLALLGLTLVITKLGKYSFQLVVSSAVFSSGVILGIAFLVSLPFHLSFAPFAKGVLFVQARSTISQLLVLWGFFLLVGLSFIILSYLLRKKRSGGLLFDVQVQRFLFVVIGFSLLLVVVPEIIYIKDIYIQDYHRANTMFKLVYQTFVMMSVITGPVLVGLFIALRRFDSQRVVILLISVLLSLGLVSVLIYPWFAIRSYYNGLKVYKGLDGVTSWFPQRYPNDYAAVLWLENNISGQPVVLEAVGESYTDHARVSTHTGLPTVLGWRVHEWLWRGSFDEPGKRSSEVQILYTSSDARQVCPLLNKHKVEYVFVGDLERKLYTPLNESFYQSVGEVVFSQGSTKVFKLGDGCLSFPYTSS